MAALKQMKEALKLKDCVNNKCPWSNKAIPENALTLYKNNVVGFCCTGCRDTFDKLVEENKTSDDKYKKAVDHFDKSIDNGSDSKLDNQSSKL
mmetsp:Transcript_55081/g.49582  ORF Transcript_55081/g.49582 Transcript_55081/m.49582 type:complete len:93 (+) Transcript_55081:39-317(+)